MKSRRWLFGLLGLCAAYVLACIVSQAIEPASYTITMIIPLGFHGQIRLTEDPAGAELRIVDGKCRIRIPPDGQLRVKSFRLFEGWHEAEYEFEGGQKINSYDHPARAARQTFGIFGGRLIGPGDHSNSYIVRFMGWKEEADAFF